MEKYPIIKGKCPRGCGNTLFLGEGGFVTCSWLGCPQPDAAQVLLERSEQFTAFVRDDRVQTPKEDIAVKDNVFPD